MTPPESTPNTFTVYIILPALWQVLPTIVGIDKAAVLETVDDLLRFVLHRQLLDDSVLPHFKSVDKVPVHKTVDDLPRFGPHDNLQLSVVAPCFKRQDQNSDDICNADA